MAEIVNFVLCMPSPLQVLPLSVHTGLRGLLPLSVTTFPLFVHLHTSVFKMPTESLLAEIGSNKSGNQSYSRSLMLLSPDISTASSSTRALLPKENKSFLTSFHRNGNYQHFTSLWKENFSFSSRLQRADQILSKRVSLFLGYHWLPTKKPERPEEESSLPGAEWWIHPPWRRGQVFSSLALHWWIQFCREHCLGQK